MSSDIESPRPERAVKRAFDGDGEGGPPSKRQYLPTSPPRPDHRLAQLHPSSCPQSIALTPPETTKPGIGPSDNPNLACDTANAHQIHNWLAESTHPSCSIASPSRPSSAPPDLAGGGPALDLGAYQGPTFAVIQQISPLQTQKIRPPSLPSTESSRPPRTSHPNYRSVLYNNGIRIDYTGEKIPEALRVVLNRDILKDRPSRLSSEEIAETMNIADHSEGQVYDLIGTAMFPIKRREIGRGGNTLWNFDALPRQHVYPIPLATPKPDIYCGYSTGPNTAWSRDETAVIDHPAARRVTQPSGDICLPFLVCELKSEAEGGTLWQAENQAAGSGSYCVNSIRWLLNEAYPSEAHSVNDSIAFSACVTHREAIFHVHFYSPADDRFYMSWIATCESMRHVQRCNHIIQNIVDYGLGVRQTKIRQALAQLIPFPKHWEMSQCINEEASSRFS